MLLLRRLLLLLTTSLTPARATVGHACGDACGPLLAARPHNDSCWRAGASAFFAFDVQPHFHVGDACFGENDPSAPFFFNGLYHVGWQSHTQYEHIPPWNKAPSGQYGDTGISFGHAVSSDGAHWRQLANSLFPDAWGTSVSVYDGSVTIVGGVPTMIVAGLTPNSTSKFCHMRATPANLSDPFLEDWRFDAEPLYCGTPNGTVRPFDAPTTAWRSSLGQLFYTDGSGNAYVSDDGEHWRGALDRLPAGMVVDFFELPRVCDGCGGGRAAAPPGAGVTPTHVHEAAGVYQLYTLVPGPRDTVGTLTAVSDGGATVANASALGLTTRFNHGNYGFPKSFVDDKGRRLQYAWLQGAAFIGQEDTLFGSLSMKTNVQSLLCELTYDPRLGILNVFPIPELALLHGALLASVSSPTAISSPSGVLALPTPLLLANQSHVTVTFALPASAVTLGVRVMTSNGTCGQACPPRTFDQSAGFSAMIGYTPPPPGALAWGVPVGSYFDPKARIPVGGGMGTLPLLRTDAQLDITVFVDHNIVEVFFMGGRYAMSLHVADSLLLPRNGTMGGNVLQGVELIASGEGVVVTQASVWRMGDAWEDVATHGRPNHM